MDFEKKSAEKINPNNKLIEKLMAEFDQEHKDREVDVQILADERKRYEVTIRDLLAEFDQDETYQELDLSEENFQKLKVKIVKERFQNYLEAEEDNEGRENITEKFHQALIDNITGLERREGLFKKLEDEFNQIFRQSIEGVKGQNFRGNIKDLSDAEKLEILKQEARDFSDSSLFVMMGDVSYLSLANVGGHRSGDNLLENVGTMIKKSDIKGFRHGGDEITALLEGTKNEVEEKLKDFRKKFSAQKNVSNLDSYNLSPNLDIGIAHLSEGFKVFKEILSDPEGERWLAKEKMFEELKNVWLEIADKRSFLNKGKERIALLMDRYQNNSGSYQEVIAFLRKGGYNISDKELQELIDKAGAESNLEKDAKIIKDFILKKEKEQIEKLGGYNRIKAEAIAGAVGIV